MTVNETELIKKCQAGDTASFEKLVELYSDRAYAVAFGVMGNPHDASDMTQEAFIKVYENIKKFNFKSVFNTWLHRIVKNTCIDEIRKRKRKRKNEISLDSKYYSGDGEYTMQIADNSPGVQETLEKQETEDMLWDALNTLDEKHRLVIVLADIKGYDYNEISEITELPLGTVKSRISRGRTKLAEIIRKNGTKF